MRISESILKLFGWSVDRSHPLPSRSVVIGAPHTSNWDFPLAILYMWAVDLDVHWVGKHTLFKGPMGPIMRKLGGVPVDRRVRGNFIGAMAEKIRSGEISSVCMAPEGTRSRTHAWKTGFYHLAVQAGVPVALGYMDYRKKVVGIGPTLEPTGDIERDMEALRDFYGTITPRFPEKYGEIRVHSK